MINIFIKFLRKIKFYLNFQNTTEDNLNLSIGKNLLNNNIDKIIAKIEEEKINENKINESQNNLQNKIISTDKKQIGTNKGN